MCAGGHVFGGCATALGNSLTSHQLKHVHWCVSSLWSSWHLVALHIGCLVVQGREDKRYINRYRQTVQCRKAGGSRVTKSERNRSQSRVVGKGAETITTKVDRPSLAWTARHSTARHTFFFMAVGVGTKIDIKLSFASPITPIILDAMLSTAHFPASRGAMHKVAARAKVFEC